MLIAYVDVIWNLSFVRHSDFDSKLHSSLLVKLYNIYDIYIYKHDSTDKLSLNSGFNCSREDNSVAIRICIYTHTFVIQLVNFRVPILHIAVEVDATKNYAKK